MFSTNLFFGQKNGKVRVNLLKKLKCDINLIPIMIKLFMGKTQVQFLRLCTLGSPIEFKHMVALTNKTQTMLYFLRIFKFNIFEFNQ